MEWGKSCSVVVPGSKEVQLFSTLARAFLAQGVEFSARFYQGAAGLHAILQGLQGGDVPQGPLVEDSGGFSLPDPPQPAFFSSPFLWEMAPLLR